MTLTEFLLARIAEDEAKVRRSVNLAFPIPGERMLAECEAKRRIVELRESAQYQVTKAGDDPTDAFALTWRSQVIAFDATLSTLATPYADHPDYQPEWRP